MAWRALPFALVPLAALALSGCGSSEGQSGPGGVTQGEAKALDEAAEMIEKQRLPEDALRTPSPTLSPAPAAPAK